MGAIDLDDRIPAPLWCLLENQFFPALNTDGRFAVEYIFQVITYGFEFHYLSALEHRKWSSRGL